MVLCVGLIWEEESLSLGLFLKYPGPLCASQKEDWFTWIYTVQRLGTECIKNGNEHLILGQ